MPVTRTVTSTGKILLAVAEFRLYLVDILIVLSLVAVSAATDDGEFS